MIKIEETKNLKMNKIIKNINELRDQVMNTRQMPATTISSKYLPQKIELTNKKSSKK